MRSLSFFAAMFFAISSLALAQADTPVDATITVDNVGATAYMLVDAAGESVGEVGAENAAWTLQVGHRYRVVNKGELLYHPFELRGDTDILLAQGDSEGTFEGDKEVNFVSDNEGVRFTLTPELAELLTNYRCGYHPVMTGSISVDGAS